MDAKRTIALAAVLLLATAGMAQGAETYKIDPTHSYVGFSVRHMGVAKVRGEFNEFAAEMKVDEQDPTKSSIALTIEAASIDTDHEQRDGHLKSADFLDVENHPQITFKSRSIEKTGDGEYVALGDLTIRGVTQQVELPFELAGPIRDPFGNMRLGASGELEIDRHDFNVSWSRVLDTGGLVVSDEVDIDFSIEAARPIEKPAGEEENGGGEEGEEAEAAE